MAQGLTELFEENEIYVNHMLWSSQSPDLKLRPIGDVGLMF